ncbi:MAG: luxQ 4, partial [Thermoleophilia bacterium]|nr:luxQ 4 [Thermoleophilia bacterium]
MPFRHQVTELLAGTRPGLDSRSLRKLVEHSPDGILVVDESGTIQLANPAATDMLGSAADLVGETFGVPLVAADKTEIDVVGPDGRMLVHELRTVAIRWGSAPAQLVMLHDVTERVQHEQRILELNAQLELQAQAANVLTHVADGVFLLDADDVIRVWNPAAARLLGVGAGRAVGSPIAQLMPEWAGIRT